MSVEFKSDKVSSIKSDQKIKVAVAKGDGIGPEIMEATIKIMEAANANIDPEYVEIGEKSYMKGYTSGITENAWETINRNKILLKAPITTPQGGGFKSLNVTLRKSLNLYSNVRPCKSLHPFVNTLHPKMDVVVIRENEEDLYAGIEHQQTPEVIQCLKLVSIPGSRKIIRYAFEYARINNRKKVTCFVKDNIMKHTDGMFHKVFNEIGKEYPSIEKEVQIIDIGTARLATKPENYDVIVTLNLYGDIVSDITAEIAGSVGLAGSANIGRNYAMFEAIHGSAPDIAGKNIANPSGLLNGACLMLQHIGQQEVAEKITNAWLRTLEDGIHTADIYNEEFSRKKVSTAEFAEEVIKRLGEKPQKLKPVSLNKAAEMTFENTEIKTQSKKELVGIDIFLDWDEGKNPNVLGELLEKASTKNMQLKMITNRGVKVYPEGNEETYCTDHWRCRFIDSSVNKKEMGARYPKVNKNDTINLMQNIINAGLDIIKTENLYYINGERGFSLGQGE